MSEPDVLANLRQMLESHDWFYEYSDDHGAWRRGKAERAQIMAEIKRVSEQGFRSEACDLYNETKPDQIFRMQ